MTSKDILDGLKAIKLKYKSIKCLYVFGSTASYTRKDLSDIDLIVIDDLDKDDNRKLVLSIKSDIKDTFGLNSDIVTGKSLDEVKDVSLNLNMFKNLIEI